MGNTYIQTLTHMQMQHRVILGKFSVYFEHNTAVFVRTHTQSSAGMTSLIIKIHKRLLNWKVIAPIAMKSSDCAGLQLDDELSEFASWFQKYLQNPVEKQQGVAT
jgi:hypothetical protein